MESLLNNIASLNPDEVNEIEALLRKKSNDEIIKSNIDAIDGILLAKLDPTKQTYAFSYFLYFFIWQIEMAMNLMEYNNQRAKKVAKAANKPEIFQKQVERLFENPHTNQLRAAVEFCKFFLNIEYLFLLELNYSPFKSTKNYN